MDYWNSKRYELIREYYLRSPWVPPFNLIGRVHHSISFVKNVFSKCSHAKVSESKFFRKKSEVFKRPMRHRFKNRQVIKKESLTRSSYNKPFFLNTHAGELQYCLSWRLVSVKMTSFNLPYSDHFLNLSPRITLNKLDNLCVHCYFLSNDE